MTKQNKTEKIEFRGKSIKRGVVTLRELYMYELGVEQGKSDAIKEILKIIDEFFESSEMKMIINEGDWGACHEIPDFYLNKVNELKSKIQALTNQSQTKQELNTLRKNNANLLDSAIHSSSKAKSFPDKPDCIQKQQEEKNGK